MPVEPEEGQYLQLGAWGYLHPYFQHPHSQPSANLSVPTSSLTCVAAAGQWWGWRGTWEQRGGRDARGGRDVLSPAGQSGSG